MKFLNVDTVIYNILMNVQMLRLINNFKIIIIKVR